MNLHFSSTSIFWTMSVQVKTKIFDCRLDSEDLVNFRHGMCVSDKNEMNSGSGMELTC